MKISLLQLRKKLLDNYVVIFFVIIFIFILVLSVLVPYIFLPVDILNYLPSYNFLIDRPNNSLISDPVFQFEPWRVYTKDYILNGQIPIWNEFNSFGVPLFANMQSAVLFPLNFIYYFFPQKFSLIFIHLIKIYLFMLFSYFYLRSLKISREISLYGSIMISSLAFLWIWLLWPHTNVFVLFPLLLFFVEKIRIGKSRSIFFVLVAFFYFIAVMGGHPQTIFHLVLVHLIYSIFRLWRNKGALFKLILFIFLGFLLSSFLLLPFIEYLLNSYVLESRLSSEYNINVLPGISIVYAFFPFIFGAPHLDFYKSLNSSFNFQEISGIYVGLPILILFLISIFKQKKTGTMLAWLTIAMICFGFSFGIFPFNIIDNLPVFNVIASHRLVGFLAFGVTVYSILAIDSAFRLKTIFYRKSRKILILLSIIILLLYLILSKIGAYLISGSEYKYIYITVFDQIYLIVYMSILYFIFLLSYFISKRKLFLLCSLLCSLVITIGFFYSYNTFSNKNHYYPKTELVQLLKSLPKGHYLQIGNPSIPENINIMYRLRNVENYDAIEFGKYKEYFDKNFPIKNHWNRVDEANQKSINNLQIDYLISDYDIRFNKVNIYNEKNLVLRPINNNLKFEFNSPVEFSAIRMLPATFDRLNLCNLSFILKQDMQLKAVSMVSCEDLSNNYFYNVNFNNILNPGIYTVEVSSSDSRKDNSVSFFGNGYNPYLDLITTQNSNLNVEKLEYFNNFYVFKNLEVENNKIIPRIDTPNYKSYYVNLTNDLVLDFEIANYPGWKIFTNGNIIEHDKSTPFISHKLKSGEYVIDLKYQPFYFYLGSLLSILTLLSILVYILRDYMKDIKKLRVFKIYLEVSDVGRMTNLWKHALIILVGLVLSTVFYLFLIEIINPTFVFPNTDSVSWYTVNKYPRQKEYFFLYSSFFVIFTLTVLFWIVYLLRRRK